MTKRLASASAKTLQPLQWLVAQCIAARRPSASSGLRRGVHGAVLRLRAAPAQAGFSAPLWVSLLALLIAALATPPLSQAQQPAGLAVLPFEDARAPRSRSWLGVYLQDALGRALARTGGTGVLMPETAALWQWKLGLTGLTAPSTAQLREMGVHAVVQGRTQRVLDLVRVELQVTGLGGTLLFADQSVVEVRLNAPPEMAVNALLDRLFPVLFPGDVPIYPIQPAEWADVEAFYDQLTRPVRQLSPAQHAERMTGLRRLAGDSALAGAAHREMALLRLLQGVGLGEAELRRRSTLEEARNLAQVALSVNPEDAAAHALKGEIHYFLKEDFQARQEANISRLKNPLDGLAWMVLALSAGLSTGQGTELSQRALQIDPFLLASNRPQGAPAFQYGALEPLLSRAQTRRSAIRSPSKGENNAAYSEGLVLFNAGQWDEAEQALRRASDADEYDPRPWLLRYRILLETERSHEAVPLLRELAGAYPSDLEIQAWLGVALRRSGVTDDSAQVFQRVLEERPNHPVVLMEQARAAGEQHRWDETRQHLRQVLADQPDNEEAWLLLSRVLLQVDQREAAITSLKQALRLLPDSVALKDALLALQPQAGAPAQQASQ